MNRKEAIKEILPIVIVTIIGTYFFSYVSYLFIEEKLPGSLLELWRKWDAGHYLKIAEEGYSSGGQQIAFFPLYPYLVKALSPIFKSYMLSALVISNLAYAAAAYFLYRIVRLDYEKDDAWRAVMYLSIFPTAYFLHAAYTESLFLALSIGSFYYGRTNKWWLSGVLGMLAAGTRLVGIILLPVLIVEYLSQKEYKLSGIRVDFLWLLLIGLGLISYLVLNYSVSGDPLYFLEVQQESWSRKLALPFEGFLNTFTGSPGRSASGAFAGDLAEAVFAILGLIGSVYSFFRLRLSYSLYLIITWLVITSSALWISIPRFTLTMFPLMILMALLGRRKGINFIIVFLSLICFSLFLSQYLRFRWAF